MSSQTRETEASRLGGPSTLQGTFPRLCSANWTQELGTRLTLLICAV